MAQIRYIQVILPLKLEWEPFYYSPEGMEVQVGSRVRVIFAGAFYTGCVSKVDVMPQMNPGRIAAIEAVEEDLPDISKEEIAFWRALAGYYLCTIGEVYKAAYPTIYNHRSKLKLPGTGLPPEGEMGPEEKSVLDSILVASKTVLLRGELSREGLLHLIRATLQQGKSVLFLVPEIGRADVIPGALIYHSALTPGKRRAVAEKLRSAIEPCLVVGTRSALFLPFRNLGLILVDQEEDPAYKQDAPAPRYHARESAIMLAGIHHAKVILTSSTPSLESLYNARCGRYLEANVPPQGAKTSIEIINISAEYRKKGIAGAFSLKLLSRMKETLDGGRQVLLVAPKRIYEQGRRVEDNVLEYFPEARVVNLDLGPADDAYDIYISSAIGPKGIPWDNLGVVGLMNWDGMLSRQDFRADERAYQLLEQCCRLCPGVVIQTREPRHPILQKLSSGESPVEQLLEERRVVGYPPFTRMIKVQIKDVKEKRLNFLSKELAVVIGQLGIRVEGPLTPSQEQSVREIRLLLPRDKTLLEKKAALGKTVAAFVENRKYSGHIVLDVDPL